MIVAIGDLHLSNSRPWSEKVSYDVIDLIINSPYNTKENTLVLLGDITDKSVVDGKVTDMIRHLFFNLHYEKTYICLGNHEGEIKNNKLCVTYDFLNQIELETNLKIIYKYQEENINGFNCLFLPHRYTTFNESLKDYETLPEEITNKEYDLCFGHITDSRCNLPSFDKVNVSYLKVKQYVYGHIHSGDYRDIGYIGSVIPNNVAENNFKRFILVIKGNNKEPIFNYEEIPNTILEYKEIDYPTPLFRSKAKTVVWTVNNAQDPDLVRIHYNRPDMFIRKCNYSSEINKEAFNEIIENTEITKGLSYFLSDWRKTKDINEGLWNKITYYSSIVS